jgi:hypothetical protein
MVVPPHRPVDSSSFCQQPGSPGWPQQLCPFRIFVALFLMRRESFLENGIGAFRFVKKSLALGLCFLCMGHLHPFLARFCTIVKTSELILHGELKH